MEGTNGISATRGRVELARYYASRDAPAASEPVRLSLQKRGLSQAGLNQAMQRIAERAGVACTPHKFRRTFATEQLRAGVNIYTLAAIMGHEDIATLRHYLKVAQADVKAASEQMDIVANMLENPGRNLHTVRTRSRSA